MLPQLFFPNSPLRLLWLMEQALSNGSRLILSGNTISNRKFSKAMFVLAVVASGTNGISVPSLLQLLWLIRKHIYWVSCLWKEGGGSLRENVDHWFFHLVADKKLHTILLNEGRNRITLIIEWTFPYYQGKLFNAVAADLFLISKGW